jgi:hypothetical protein
MGPPGPTGPIGPSGGPPGPIGPIGPPGLDGLDGADGIDGLAGARGLTGATGPQGATGPTGGMGPPGTDGTDGEDGDLGPVGPRGLTGASGPTGPGGPPGAPGMDGLDGMDGDPGPPGASNAVPLVTAMPTIGRENDIVDLYVANGGAPVIWRFRYSQADLLWIFVGGAPLLKEIASGESTASTTYVDLTTAGPSITVPQAGDYLVRFESQVSTGGGNDNAWVSVKIGAAATSDNQGNPSSTSNTVPQVDNRTQRISVVADGDVLKVQYRTLAGGTITFAKRVLEILPFWVT